LLKNAEFFAVSTPNGQDFGARKVALLCPTRRRARKGEPEVAETMRQRHARDRDAKGAMPVKSGQFGGQLCHDFDPITALR
jgi:hypothetical protein